VIKVFRGLQVFKVPRDLQDLRALQGLKVFQGFLQIQAPRAPKDGQVLKGLQDLRVSKDGPVQQE
jgi:hypothetical protein